MQNYGEDYANLLIWQYRNKPVLKGLIEKIINSTQLFDNIEVLRNAFNYDTAEGQQLRRLGWFLGLPNITELNNLDDVSYRRLMSLKTIINNSNASIKAIVEGLYNVFGNAISVVNNYNMNLFYFVAFSSTLVSLAVKYDLLPRPLGVGITIIDFETQSVRMTDSTDINNSYGIDGIGSNGLGALYNTNTGTNIII